MERRDVSLMSKWQPLEHFFVKSQLTSARGPSLVNKNWTGDLSTGADQRKQNTTSTKHQQTIWGLQEVGRRKVKFTKVSLQTVWGIIPTRSAVCISSLHRLPLVCTQQTTKCCLFCPRIFLCFPTSLSGLTLPGDEKPFLNDTSIQVLFFLLYTYLQMGERTP